MGNYQDLEVHKTKKIHDHYNNYYYQRRILKANCCFLIHKINKLQLLPLKKREKEERKERKREGKQKEKKKRGEEKE